jgi:hypothetical protein
MALYLFIAEQWGALDPLRCPTLHSPLRHSITVFNTTLLAGLTDRYFVSRFRTRGPASATRLKKIVARAVCNPCIHDPCCSCRKTGLVPRDPHVPAPSTRPRLVIIHIKKTPLKHPLSNETRNFVNPKNTQKLPRNYLTIIYLYI